MSSYLDNWIWLMNGRSPHDTRRSARFLKTCVAALVCLLATSARTQTSQFLFDPRGNFQAQAGESLAPPQILGQPQMQIVIPGESASFSVIVADTRGLSYQWFFNGAPISGATKDALLITNVSATNEGQYSVSVSNASGPVLSSSASLSIDSDSDGLPDSWEIAHFGNLNQTATGDFDRDGVSNLQEFLDGTDPTDAASVLYRITLFNDGGTVVTVPDQANYTNGQVVTLTATGSEAFPFHAWTGDIFSQSNSITLAMTNNKTLFARFTPVTFQWTNTVSGDWNTASNWTPNIVPGSNDSVLILTAATITLNSNADVADFTFGYGNIAPVLTGNGVLTIRRTGAWGAGTMSGAGRTVIAPGASFNISSASSITLSGRTLENGGTAFWPSGGVFAINAGVITNDAGALFQLQSPASINYGGGSPRFDNAGSFLATGGGAITFASIPFNNYGTVDLQSGTFRMLGGGVHAGSVAVAVDATVNFASGTFASSGSPSITGAGTLLVSGGASTLAGTVNVSGSNVFSNGSVDFTGNYTCTNNTMVISGGGIANFDGTGVISPMVLNMSGLGTLGGSVTVTVGSVMNWTAGTMTGTGRTVIPAGATLNIGNGSPLSVSGRTVDNGGTALWSGGTMGLNDGVLTNEAGALFQIQNPGTFAYGGGSPRVDNAGVFRLTGGGTTFFASLNFNNYHDTQIQGGTLRLNGGLNNGTMEVPAGTTINLSSGVFNSSGGSTISGAGSFIVDNGSATLAGTVNVAGSNVFSGGSIDFTGNYISTNNSLVISGGVASFDGTGSVSPSLLNLSGGSLGGSDVVTVGNIMNWTGGSMTGSGRTVIPAGSTLHIGSGSALSIINRTLDNGGTTTWTGTGAIALNGAIITNRVGALFNPQNASSIFNAGGSARFDNAGTFRKSVSTGKITFSGVAFNNFDTVDIQNGLLAANGGYVSSSNAVLNCALSGTTPGTNYGQLQVSGSVNLNGTLSVNLTNNYVPSTNDSFTVLSAGARNGAFADFIYPSNRVSMLLSTTITSVIVRVTGIAGTATQQPILLSPTLSGTNVLLSWTAVSNTTYRLEFNQDLAPSNWNALPGDVLGVSNTASKQDTLTSSNRFYRVHVLP